MSTTETAALDIAVNTFAAIPTMPFIPGPDTFTMQSLSRVVIPLTANLSSAEPIPIKVPLASGLAVFLIRQGI